MGGGVVPKIECDERQEMAKSENYPEKCGRRRERERLLTDFPGVVQFRRRAGTDGAAKL